jgi:hypothetical protein
MRSYRGCGRCSPGVSGLGVPGSAGVSGVPSVPGVSGLNVPGSPGVSGLGVPGSAGVSGVPSAPGVSGLGVPGVPGRGVPGVPAAPMTGHTHRTLTISTATNRCIGSPPLSSQGWSPSGAFLPRTNIHLGPAQEERRIRARQGAVRPFTKSDEDRRGRGEAMDRAQSGMPGLTPPPRRRPLWTTAHACAC